MCIAHRLLLSTSEISDVTASMPSLGYFALQHRAAPPRKAYSLTSSAFIAFGALYPFSLFKPVFRGFHKNIRRWLSSAGFFAVFRGSLLLFHSISFFRYINIAFSPTDFSTEKRVSDTSNRRQPQCPLKVGKHTICRYLSISGL